MKIRIMLCLCLVAGALGAGCPNGVIVPDPALAQVIRETLNLAPGHALSDADLQRVYDLRASGWGIVSLEGLERCTNAHTLSLNNNQISDLTPLLMNSGLGAGDTITVHGNPLPSEHLCIAAAALESRGATISHDDIIHAAIEIEGPPPNGILQPVYVRDASQRCAGDTLSRQWEIFDTGFARIRSARADFAFVAVASPEEWREADVSLEAWLGFERQRVTSYIDIAPADAVVDPTLIGSWTGTQTGTDGVPRSYTYHFRTGGAVQIDIPGGFVAHGAYEPDFATFPPALDIRIDREIRNGEQQLSQPYAVLAVYEASEGSIRLAYSGTSRPRPADFSEGLAEFIGTRSAQ